MEGIRELTDALAQRFEKSLPLLEAVASAMTGSPVHFRASSFKEVRTHFAERVRDIRRSTVYYAYETMLLASYIGYTFK